LDECHFVPHHCFSQFVPVLQPIAQTHLGPAGPSTSANVSALSQLARNIDTDRELTLSTFAQFNGKMDSVLGYIEKDFTITKKNCMFRAKEIRFRRNCGLVVKDVDCSDFTFVELGNLFSLTSWQNDHVDSRNPK
jgi:hypothetical protein